MNIVQKMEGSNAFDFSFRKKDEVASLGKKVTISAEKVPIDPQLFSRGSSSLLITES